MANGIQRKIAMKTGLSVSFISLLINGKRRPSWRNAKRIARVTGTEPSLWMDGSPKQMQKVLADLKVVTYFDIKARKKVSDICRTPN